MCDGQTDHVLDLLDLEADARALRLVCRVSGKRSGAGRGLSELEIKAETERLIATPEARGAKIYVPRADRDYAISVGLEMLTLRHVVDEAEGLYTARPEEARLIAYYANCIAQLLQKD